MSVATAMVTALTDDVTVGAAFDVIQHSWDNEPQELGLDNTPALLVWPNSHTGADNEHDQFVSQYLSESYNVMVICDHADLTDRLAEVRGVLLGWQYPSNTRYDLMEFLEGSPVRISGDVIWWLDVWFCNVELRQVVS